MGSRFCQHTQQALGHRNIHITSTDSSCLQVLNKMLTTGSALPASSHTTSCCPVHCIVPAGSYLYYVYCVGHIHCMVEETRGLCRRRWQWCLGMSTLRTTSSSFIPNLSSIDGWKQSGATTSICGDLMSRYMLNMLILLAVLSWVCTLHNTTIS